jgi:TIR domain-containing protein
MGNAQRRPFIFIVYQDFEYVLAITLQHLLQEWGYEVFQCRQTDRDGSAYRAELRENIRKCDLVVLLLSREFRWSPYCQAEAGTTMALEKPYIPVLVPPARTKEVGDEIAKVLEGVQLLRASDPNFISLLQAAIAERLNKGRENLRNLICRLQAMEGLEVTNFAPSQAEEDSSKRADVLAAIKSIEKRYKLSQPERRRVSSFPHLYDDSCKSSIVGNIVEGLETTDETTFLTFVGVSLKFSLHYITDALQAFSRQARTGSGKKKLSISLVYMDDQSHILHALDNTRDMGAIQSNLGRKWKAVETEWRRLCGEIIDLADPVLYRIDYIPPQVGILIETGDKSVLYAGRCSFNQEDLRSSGFTLDVGENEYFFYKKVGESGDDDSATNAIRQFKKSVNAYAKSHNNSGVTPVWGSNDWVRRLSKYVEKICTVYNESTHKLERAPDPAELTFISGTATKFEGLIIEALGWGAKVRTYVRDSGTPPRRVRHLYDRLRRQVGEMLAGGVEQHRYQHPATFRAVVIGNLAIGLQIYVNADEASLTTVRRQGASFETVRKIPLCFIVTPCFEHFEQLKDAVLTFAKGDPLAEEVFSSPI